MSDQRITVFLVDDQPFIGVVVKKLLAGEPDIDLHCCYKAVDAVAQANQIHPTIILQDLVLPGIDGLALVRMYRENPATASTAIVVLSGNDDSQTRARAIAGGANDYLVKLPTTKDLVACIRRHTTPVRSAVNAPTLSSVEGSPKHDPDGTLDLRAIAEFRSVGSADFARSVIDQFVREAESQVEILRDARRRLDAPLAKATAHSLKGSSLTMGAGKLARLCMELEASPVCCESRTVERDLVSEVDREFVKVCAALAIERQVGRQ
jgi:CheY-like chemotaxis protein/HPt (histidine-containing phosphotransfer) domain-containing protein